MNAHTTTAEERIARTTETRKASNEEVCLGVIMAVGAVVGLWGVISLICQFVG